MWRLTGEELGPAVQEGFLQSTVLGNDAVIVARQLARLGHDVTCVALGPTTDDIALVTSRLSGCRVIAIDEVPGPRTHTLCIEAASGTRSWLFPRVPAVGSNPPSIDVDVLYVDYYREFRPYVDRHIDSWHHDESVIVVNFSDASEQDAFPVLGFRPTVIQVSVEASDAGRVHALAQNLQTQTGAQLAVVTAGGAGAAFASASSSAFARPPSLVEEGRSVLGAGAVFSAALIEALLEHGPPSASLADQVVTRAAERLRSLKSDADDHS